MSQGARPAPLRRRWPWLLAIALSVVAVSLSLWWNVRAGLPLISHESGFQPDVLFVASYLGVGWFVLRRDPANRLGPLLIAIAAAQATAGMTSAWAAFSFFRHGADLPLTLLAYQTSGVGYTASFAGFTVLLPLWFPDGRAPVRWLRPVAWLTMGGVTAFAAAIWLGTNGVDTDGEMVAGRVLGPVSDTLFRISSDLQRWLPWCGLAALVIRYALAGDRVRGQLRWFALPAAAIALDAIELTRTVPGWLDVVRFVPWWVVAVVLAVRRHDLFDGRGTVRQSALYVLALASIVVTFVAGVELVAVLSGLDRTTSTVVALIVVPLATLPVREQARQVAERVVYGGARDASAALRAMSQRVSTSPAEGLVGALADTARTATRANGVRIELDDGTVAEAGEMGSTAATFELMLDGRTLGALHVASTADHLDRAGRSAVDALIPVIAIAAAAVERDRDVRDARGRLVTAREEERRRLRRDLHDGLGPSLAGITMEIQAARACLLTDPARADHMLAAAESWARASIDEIRRVVYALRPPALDQFGLVRAIEQHAATLPPPLEVRIDAARATTALPAAAEVAIYHIVLEALTNVTRHSRASRCDIALGGEDGAFDIEVIDDGIGVEESAPAGAGMATMRERAEELGGHCAIGRVPGGGTRVFARIPVGAPA